MTKERFLNRFVIFDDENKSKRSNVESMEDVESIGCFGWPKTAEGKVAGHNFL